MRRLGALLRRLADRLDPWEYEEEAPENPITHTVILEQRPSPISEPIDFDYLHRAQVYDHSHYIEENDVYGFDGYL